MPVSSVVNSCCEDAMSSRAPGKSRAAINCWIVGWVAHTAWTNRSFSTRAAVFARRRLYEAKRAGGGNVKHAHQMEKQRIPQKYIVARENGGERARMAYTKVGSLSDLCTRFASSALNRWRNASISAHPFVTSPLRTS